MKITINKETRRIVLKWLQKGVINTDELAELNKARDDWFEELMKEMNDEEPVFTREDIERIEKLSQAVIGLKFPTREDMLKELERLENMEREDKYCNM